MSTIDYLHTTPQDRYEAASVANNFAGGKCRPGGIVRGALGILAILAVAVGLITLRVWIVMPASFHFHG